MLKVNATPSDVVRYLNSLRIESPYFAYIGLDERWCAHYMGGALEAFGLANFDRLQPIERQLVVLEGLLPSGREPVVVANAHNTKGLYYDLHLFQRRNTQWVLFLENSEAGAALQLQQQERLIKELIFEKALNVTNDK